MLHRTLTLLIVIATAASGCVSVPGSDLDSTGAVDDAAAVLGPRTEELTGDIAASVATPIRSFNNGGTFALPLPRHANDTGYVLEVVWESTAPMNDNLDVWLRDAASGTPTDPQSVVAGPGPIATATGASPLRLTIAASDFPDDADYNILLRAAGPAGAAANQPFTIHLTTFRDVPYDAEYSALGDGAEHGH